MTRRLFGDRRKERANQQMLQTRIANSIAGDLRNEISQTMIKAIDEYEREGSDIVLSSFTQQHEENIREILENSFMRSAVMAGERILGQSKGFHGKLEVKQENEMKDYFLERVQQFLITTGLTQVVGISKTTEKILQNLVSREVGEGNNVDEIARKMREKVPMFSGYRSMRIARTETHSSYNAGHDLGGKSSNLDLSKEWISAIDDRTRDDFFDHVAADGEIVTLDSMFNRTGEPLQYPGDYGGSAGNIIHCRCARGDVVN